MLITVSVWLCQISRLLEQHRFFFSFFLACDSMEDYISPRKDQTNALILSVNVTDAEDNHSWESHTANLMLPDDDTCDFIWDDLDKRVVMETARSSPRGFLGKDSFIFQRFPVEASRVEISFKLWLSGAIAALRWIQTCIDTENLFYCSVEFGMRPPPIISNLLEYSRSGTERVFEVPVLNNKAILSFAYHAESVADRTFGGREGRIAFKWVKLKLKEGRLLKDILSYKGHKIGLLIGQTYLGRANTIEDRVIEESDEIIETNTRRLLRDEEADGDSQKKSTKAEERIYIWEDDDGEDEDARYLMKGYHDRKIENMGDMRNLKKMHSSTETKSFYDFSDLRVDSKTKEVPYVPDSPNFSNEVRILPFKFDSSDDMLELKFANFRFDPPKIMPIYLGWEDFVEESGKEKKGSLQSNLIGKIRQEKERNTISSSSSSSSKFFSGKLKNSIRPGGGRRRNRRFHINKRVIKVQDLSDVTGSHEIGYMNSLPKSDNKNNAVIESEIELTPANGLEIRIKYSHTKTREEDFIEITRIWFKAKEFEKTLSFSQYWTQLRKKATDEK